MMLHGVDGCRAGWLVASCDADRFPAGLSFEIRPTLNDLFSAAPDSDAIIAIDVPIGLSEREPRACDLEARRVLGRPRSSSVFPAPCRGVLGTTSYDEACLLSFDTCGKRISQQTWHILDKVKDVDALMTPARQRTVREAHPEVSFYAISGEPMQYRKSTPPGQAERLAILRTYGLELEPLDERRRLGGRANVAADDIIDAAVCLLTARRIADKPLVLSDGALDARGLRMEIVA
jgi:predicted RNase H-like nuclease